MTDETPIPALLINSHETDLGTDRPLLVIELDAVYLNGEGEVRNYINGEPLDSLHIRAQHDASVTPNPYGWETEYSNVFSVRTDRAATMLRTLKKVERGLARYDANDDYAADFQTYVARVAKILGIKTFGWRTSTWPTGNYNSNTYAWVGVTGGLLRISDLVGEFNTKYNVAVAS